MLRILLSKIKRTTPSWYAIFADEATDVANREQLNLSLRWVDDEYEVCEDPLGFFVLPNTTADTITSEILSSDVIYRCHSVEDKFMMGLQTCKVEGLVLQPR